MPTTNNEQQSDTPNEENEGIHEMYDEIKGDIAQLKKRPPENYQAFFYWFVRTAMPYLRDMAYYVRENTVDIEQLFEHVQGSLETQFTPEHAKKFDLVLQFAHGQTKEMIESGQLSAEQLAIVKTVHETAAECLKIVEESVIETEDGDDAEEEEEEDGGQQN